MSISIIVPVYNAEQYLPKCLDSILNQTYKYLEVICINDGSCDNSINILNQYKAQDSRMVVINKSNEGVSATRNCGLKQATGEYFMFVDADDWIEPDTCEKVLTVMEDNNADIVMWSYVSERGFSSSPKTIFPNDCVFENPNELKQIHRRFIGLVGDELAHPELADSLSTVWGKLYKKSLLETSKVEFIDLAELGTYEDGMFNLQIFQNVNKIAYISKCFYHYRKTNQTSVTSVYKENLFGQWQTLYKKMGQYIDANRLPEIYHEALKNRIALSILGLGLNIMGADVSYIQKVKMIKVILSTNRYKEAYKNLKFSYFPVHWKVFYGCAKYNMAVGLVVMLMVIQWMISGRGKDR